MTKRTLFLILLLIAMITVMPIQASANTFAGSYNSGDLPYSFAGIYSNAYQDQLAVYFKQWDSASSRISMSKGEFIRWGEA